MRYLTISYWLVNIKDNIGLIECPSHYHGHLTISDSLVKNDNNGLIKCHSYYHGLHDNYGHNFKLMWEMLNH